ncbi:uncharacterized protein LOC133371221 [Rhineura floridana]|uniref:uncharacterized protein LOC133371221 n=1 Tax=Rhineura floridana TaxID=261503 RepID=UPI002AC8043F|nr:uncharacterized protein LOC133371221 [Rhineura floridana]
MQRALLCALVLLSALGGDASGKAEEGKLCKWLYESQPLAVGDVQCAEQREGAGVKLCCGTCSVPCCCALGGARTDEEEYPTARKLETILEEEARLCSSNPAEYWMTFFLFSGGFVFAGVCWLCIYCHCTRFLQFLHAWRSHKEQQLQLSHLGDAGCSRRASVIHPGYRGTHMGTASPSGAEGCQGTHNCCLVQSVQFRHGHFEDEAVTLCPETLPFRAKIGRRCSAPF